MNAMTELQMTPLEETGQTMTEYAVVLGVIATAVVFAFSTLSGVMEDAFERAMELVRIAAS